MWRTTLSPVRTSRCCSLAQRGAVSPAPAGCASVAAVEARDRGSCAASSGIENLPGPACRRPAHGRLAHGRPSSQLRAADQVTQDRRLHHLHHLRLNPRAFPARRCAPVPFRAHSCLPVPWRPSPPSPSPAAVSKQPLFLPVRPRGVGQAAPTALYPRERFCLSRPSCLAPWGHTTPLRGRRLCRNDRPGAMLPDTKLPRRFPGRGDLLVLLLLLSEHPTERNQAGFDCRWSDVILERRVWSVGTLAARER
jgi:hypothetical protein